ncbi:tetratricopeptide repeat protein 16-like isoform X1 [Biomphalaria glabrata]|uniref:Tetratricopeptide repeat protein 16-like isoform X1 n=1 Tax=Biomphalaria glabrata TaxID=6526 RepID=A0A9U8E857_BIOGL|nr:tetratricopeptide repeat protein 16-like isoform X1 [Biomphalaria glabrata]
MDKKKKISLGSLLPTSALDTLSIIETPEPDSFFGDSESLTSPFNVETDPSNQVFHADPGDVNVHQFYPVLEHTFNRKQPSKKDLLSLVAIAEEDLAWDHKNTNSIDEHEEVHEAVADKDLIKDNNELLSTNQTIETHETVFTTAVDEDCLQAAILRSQSGQTYSSSSLGGKLNQKEKLNNIIADAAWQHYHRALEKKNNPDNVVTFLNKAINLLPHEATFYSARGEAFIQLCDLQSAILNYKKACLLDQQNQDYYFRLAFLYYFQGQILFDRSLYTEALELFTKASNMVPSSLGYSIRSITCLAALQRNGECMALVNKRLEIDRKNPDLFILRARLHDLFRNTIQCYYDVKAALDLDPEHTEGKVMMDNLIKVANANKIQAMELDISGRHREALQKMMIAISTNPSVADFHVLRGALYRKLSDFNSAIDDFLLAIEKCDHNEADPVYRNAQRQLLVTYNDFAVECFHKGFYDEALVLLNKALKGEKKEKSLYVNRGDCFYKQGDITFALEDYYLALEIDPQNAAIKSRIAAIHCEMGENLSEEKKYSEAEEKFTSAIEYNPKIGQFYISRARVRLLMEDVSGAKEDILLGLLLDPTNDEIISIMTRLFPGKSVGDVRSSPDAQMALSKLSANIISTSSTAITNLRPKSPSIEDGSVEVDNETVRKSDVTKQTMKFVMCMEEREFYLQQVREKKKVESKVKDALLNRRTLRYTGARLQALPPPQPLKKKSKSTNWRTFSLGVGGL